MEKEKRNTIIIAIAITLIFFGCVYLDYKTKKERKIIDEAPVKIN